MPKKKTSASSFSSSSVSTMRSKDGLTPEQEVFQRESLEFYRKPDLLSLIKQEFDKDHLGDDREKLFVFCSELSSRLPPEYRFSTALTGYTSEGKTHLWKTTSKHLPHGWYYDLTRATKATIEDDLAGIDLVYFGEEGANEAIIETVKMMVEDGIHVLKKDLRDDCRTARKEDQPRKVGIYSTTKDASDEELATRYAVACITGSPEKYTKVNMNTLQVASDIDLEVQRSMRDTGMTWIKSGLSQLQPMDHITIPYASLLHVDNRRARSMRDLKRFLNLVRSLAWLHQLQRVIITRYEKRVLYAAPMDYYAARVIGDDIFAQSLTGVEHRLAKVIDAYRRAIYDKDHPEYLHTFTRDGKDDPRYDNTLQWVDRSVLQDIIGIAKRDTIRSHIKTLEGLGLFTTVWTGNRCFVAMKDPSATNPATKHRLITDQLSESYPKIVEDYNTKMVGELVADKVSLSPTDLGLLVSEKNALGEKTTSHQSPKKRIKVRKKTEIGQSEMVGEDKQQDKHVEKYVKKTKAYTTPDNVRQFILQEGDDDGGIDSVLLIKRFGENYISDMIQSGLLVIRRNDGKYIMKEAIVNDEKEI